MKTGIWEGRGKQLAWATAVGVGVATGNNSIEGGSDHPVVADGKTGFD
jgi:hypothetical protein